MNTAEIKLVIPALVEQSFDASEFSPAFIQAFGAKDVTFRRAVGGVA